MGELKALIDRSQVVKVAAGGLLGISPNDRRTVYLLSGIVEVLSGQEVNAVVAAGTGASRHPLLSAKSVGMSLRAKMDATLLKVSVDTDDLMFQGGNTSDYEVSDIDSATGTDWLTRFLQAKVFTRLPPSNIRKLLARMEEVEVCAGQVIMRQDETDDFYYIVKEGVCRVTTRSPADGAEVHLTDLKEGDGFGEDALITNGRRGATVTMVNDGRLMRLAKEDFTALLVEPVLRYVTWEQAQGMVKDAAVLLDVRRSEEAAGDGAAAVNIPLGLLRSRLQELDAARIHITISNVLNRSSAAAFLLCQQGMDVYILEEGAQAVMPVAAAEAPALRVVPPPVAPVEGRPVPAPSEEGGLSLAPAQGNEAPVAEPLDPGRWTFVPVTDINDSAAVSGGPPPEPVPEPVQKDGPYPLQEELEAAKQQLAQETERRTQAEGLIKRQDEQLRLLHGHLEQSRSRLKKVVSLAGAKEAKCRELQAHAERLETHNGGLRQQIAERERRLAETELLRRKLEGTVAVLQARQTAAAAPRGASGEDAAHAAPAGPEALPAQAPAPAEPATAGRGIRGAVRYGVWAALLLALAGATSLALYDMALTRPGAAQAQRAHGATPASLPLSLPPARARHGGRVSGGPA